MKKSAKTPRTTKTNQSIPKAPTKKNFFFSQEKSFLESGNVSNKASPFFSKPAAPVIQKTNQPIIQRGGTEVEALLEMNAEASDFFNANGITYQTVAAFTKNPHFSLAARQAVANAWNIGKEQDYQVDTTTEVRAFDPNTLVAGANCTNRRDFQGLVLCTMSHRQKNDLSMAVPLIEDVQDTFQVEPIPEDRIIEFFEFVSRLIRLLRAERVAVVNCQAGKHRSVSLAILCESSITGTSLGNLYEDYVQKSKDAVLITLLRYVKIIHGQEPNPRDRDPDGNRIKMVDWLKNFTA